MNTYNTKRSLLFLLVIAFLIINSIIVYVIYKNNTLAPADSSADTASRIVLTKTVPSDLTTAAVGSSVTVSLSIDNTEDIGVSEIVLTYDSNALTAVAILDQEVVLSLNKSITTPGRITIDIANAGAGNFPANTALVNFLFSIKTKSTSTISVSSESTLGYPNKLTAAGRGSLPLVFQTVVNDPTTSCGDGVIQTPNSAGVTEQCDNGGTNGTVCNPSYGGNCQYCSSQCTLITRTGGVCGDSAIQDSSETCDDGNTSNGDGCSVACQIEQQVGSPGAVLPTTPVPSSSNPTTSNNQPIEPETTGSNNQIIDTPDPVISSETIPENTTGRTVGSNQNSAVTTVGADTTAISNTNNSRTVLMGVLAFTIIGTIVTMFFLVKTLLQKPAVINSPTMPNLPTPVSKVTPMAPNPTSSQFKAIQPNLTVGSVPLITPVVQSLNIPTNIPHNNIQQTGEIQSISDIQKRITNNSK